MTQSQSQTTGIGFAGLLQITFIALKLTGVIDWPWWLVMTPTWASLLIALVVALIFILLVVLASWKLSQSKRP